MVLGVSLALLFGCMAAGCAWSRIETNTRLSSVDTSSIEVGTTHWREVLRTIGPPDVPLKDLRHFHYKSRDQRLTGFKIGWFLFLPFQWSDRQRITDILIEFGKDGLVASISKTTRDTIRPPLQGSSSRESMVTEVDMGGGS
jgi:hypothetical protein